MAIANEPIVSVLMTSYNREAYIEQSIQSVIQSTFSDLELIISDDCSSDRTVEMVREYEKKDPRVRLNINKKNLGDYPNRNMAASIARGKYIMYVDSDDTIQPDAIEYIVKYFLLHPEAQFSVIYSNMDISSPMVLSTKDSIRKHFLDRSFLNLGPGGIVIERNFFLSIGGYSEKYGPANDLFSHLKFASFGNVLLLPYKYLNYRIHDGQESANKYVYLYLNQLFIYDVLETLVLPLSDKEKKIILQRYSRNNLKNIIKYILKTRNFSLGIQAIKKAKFKLNYFFY